MWTVSLLSASTMRLNRAKGKESEAGRAMCRPWLSRLLVPTRWLRHVNAQSTNATHVCACWHGRLHCMLALSHALPQGRERPTVESWREAALSLSADVDQRKHGSVRHQQPGQQVEIADSFCLEFNMTALVFCASPCLLCHAVRWSVAASAGATKTDWTFLLQILGPAFG